MFHNNVKEYGKEVITRKIVAIQDACKVSDRDAVRIMITSAKALGHNENNDIINCSSISRKRLIRDLGAMMFDRFTEQDVDGIIVHWDEKILSVLTGKE